MCENENRFIVVEMTSLDFSSNFISPFFIIILFTEEIIILLKLHERQKEKLTYHPPTSWSSTVLPNQYQTKCDTQSLISLLT